MEKTIIIKTPVRKCGRQKKGALYLMGGEGGSPDGVLDRFVTIKPPIPYNVKLHRSFRIVDAYAILGREPMDNWWAGSSKDTEEKKKADEWAKQLFGMTLTIRLSIGECAGAGDAENALAVLTSKVGYNHRIKDHFRNLTIKEVHELPRVTIHYEKLMEALHQYSKYKKVDQLIDAQASIWRIAYTLPPSKREDVVPELMSMLVFLNLRKDAIAMRKKFMTNGGPN